MTARSGRRFGLALSLFGCIALVLLFLLPAMAPAASVQESPLGKTPFAGSQFIAETDKVKEGENIGYTLILHAGASATPQRITVEFPIPEPALLVTASPELALNEAERKLTWQGETAPGQYLNFMVVLAPKPGSAAGSGTLQAAADIFWPGGTHRFQSETEILASDSVGHEPKLEAAEVSFAGSELIASADKVREGETIAYTLAVRASGSEIPQQITVVFRPPDPVMLVSSSPPMVFSEEYQRELTWEGEISPGQEIVFTITLVTMPDSASSGILPANAGISWRPKDREWETASHWLSTETKIRAKLTPTLYVLPNGIGLGKVELIVLGYLLGGSLFTFLIPMLILRREKRLRATQPESAKQESLIENYLLFVMAFVFVFTLGIAHFMISVAAEDIRRFVAYEKVSCTLLDKRIVRQGSSSFSSRGSGPSGLRRATVFNKPLVAVRYLVGGREIIAAGSPRPTALLSPLDKYARRELARYERGTTYPCWYDPQQPETFVLARGISWGWYLSGAGSLLLLYFL
jgi:hypothetical protein